MKYWKIINITIVVMLTIVLVCDSYAGSPNRRGTAGATELLIPVGSAGIGMSGAVLGTARGLDAIHWNPAGLARSTMSAEVMFSRLDYIADIGVNYLAVAANFEDIGYLGVTLKSLSFGDIEVTTIDKPDGAGITYSPTFITAGLTYARRMTDRIYFGTNVKMVYESVSRVEATAFAFDLGLQYKAGVTGFNFGVVLKNLGSKGRFDGPDFERSVEDPNQPLGFPQQPMRLRTAAFDLPTTLELGLAYTYPLVTDHSLTFNTTFVNNNYSNDEYRFGAEYSFKDIVFLRGGYSLTTGIPSLFENIYGPTFGAGVQYDVGGVLMSVDYAYRQTKFFSANQWFTVHLGF
jgi:hypothetical protein